MNAIGHIKVLDSELLILKRRSVRWRICRTCNINAVIIAEFDHSKKTLSKGLFIYTLCAIIESPFRDVLTNEKLVPTCRIDRGHACSMISERT